MIKHFKTNVLLKDTLGQNLINDDNLAVLELVKNSFDAKAKEVHIVFKYLTDKTKSDMFEGNTNRISTLIIQDTGTGMSMDDIENKWLNIAYSEKKDKSDVTTQVFAGDKGVGRFSCDRLGKELNLYTKKADSDTIIYMYINWLQFEKYNIDTKIEDIDVRIDEISTDDLKKKGYEIGIKGTILEIKNLRTEWDKRKVKELKVHYLGKLINPNQVYVKEKITISLTCHDFPELIGIIDNRVFEKLNYRTTSIEASTNYNKENKKLFITTILRHKGKQVLKIIEENTRFASLKEVNIVLFYLNPYAKSRFLKEQGMRVFDYGSVFLFLNGFRVSPYGEKGNDWLSLDERKGQGQNRFIGTREIVGRIEITDFEGIFRPVSSREGLVKNDTFNLLVNRFENHKDLDAQESGYGFFYETLRSLERYVVDGLNWDSAVSKNYAGEFETKLLKGEKVEEIYPETDTEKDKRCLEALQSIIKNRSGEIISLEIDNDFVLQLLDSDEEKNKNLLKNLEKYTGKLTKDTQKTIDRISKILKEKDEELEKQKQRLSEEERKRKEAEEYAAKEAEKTRKAEEKARKAEEKTKEEEQKRIAAEQKRKEEELRRIAAEQKKKEAELKQKEAEQKEREAEFKRKEEERKRKIAEEEAAKEKKEKEVAQEEAEKEKEALNVEKQKNTYLISQRRFNDDTEGLIHHVSIWSGKAKSKIERLIRRFNELDILDAKLQKDLIELNLFIEKTSTIANIITRSGFKKDEDKQVIEICQYFEQYIKIYHQIYSDELSKSISVKFIGNDFSLLKNISPLELSIIIDNLISNSLKWKAKNIVFEIVNCEKESLKMLVYDDGSGLSDTFLTNPNQIFELGITESSGSGIGLYFVKNIMNNPKNINGNILFVGNNVKLKGACFELTFN